MEKEPPFLNGSAKPAHYLESFPSERFRILIPYGKLGLERKFNEGKIQNGCLDPRRGMERHFIERRMPVEKKEEIRKAKDAVEARPKSAGRKRNRYGYALLVSSLAFALSFVVAVIGWSEKNVLFDLETLYPVYALITLIYLIYTAVTFRKRNVLDWMIAAVLVTAVTAITVQCFVYLYRARTGNYYFELYYGFPGLLTYCTYFLVSMSPETYELSSTVLLFDPTLVASLLCLAPSLALYLFERKKGGKAR